MQGRWPTRSAGSAVRCMPRSSRLLGTRFVHDQPELAGWQVEIGRRTEGQRAGAIGLQDRQDRRRATGRSVPPRPGPGDLAAHPQCARNGNEPAGGYSRSRHRPALRNGIHATLLAIGHPCPVSELFGAGGRELLSSTAVVDSARKENRPWKDRDQRNVSLDGVLQDPTGEAASSTAAGSARLETRTARSAPRSRRRWAPRHLLLGRWRAARTSESARCGPRVTSSRPLRRGAGTMSARSAARPRSTRS